MTWLAFWLNAAVFGVALVAVYAAFLKTIRKKACFDMYAVRDDLVYLVVSGALNEDGRVFQHYYSRANAMLVAKPRVGLDDMLDQIFAQRRNTEDFDELLKSAEAKAERLFGDEAFANADVRCIVGNYYSGVRNMILAHSSFLRLIYVIARHTAGSFPKFLLRSVPRVYARALRAAEYANHEADVIRGAQA